QITGMHQTHFQSMNYEFAALAVPMLSWVNSPKEKNSYGVAAVSVYTLSVGGIQRRSVNETDEPNDTFGATDLAYSLSYAYALKDNGLSLGLSTKFVDSSIDTHRGTAMAADIGALYQRGRLSLGLGARNMGNKIKIDTVGDPLPLVIFSGAGYHF